MTGLRNWSFILCFVLLFGLYKAEGEAEGDPDPDAAADSYDGTTRAPSGGDRKNECEVLNPTACDRNRLEVCSFREGGYKCECPPNHSRLSDGRCLVVNECFEKKFNDCSDNADCTDTLESFLCKCKSGYADLSPDKQKPGRICKQNVDECADPTRYAVNCDANASCQNTEDSYTCVCNPGFVDASERFSLQTGRKCQKDGDPCASSTTNDCSKFATCTSCKGTYTCQCKSGYKDVSPNTAYPGRDCRPPESTSIPSSSTCEQKKETPQPSVASSTCPCPQGMVRSSDGKCSAVDHCTGTTDCDPNANCINRGDSYDCQCKIEYIDNSPDLNKRGRKCVLPENKCSSRDKNDCSPLATCHPNLNIYECICPNGFLDTSALKGQQRGRVCLEEKDFCNDRSLNTCDENADCVKKPDGYACLCQTGFVDVSSSANLSPGRVCVLQTSCPSQPTELMFLVDGSGSIGSALFKSEVLRFVSEFVTLFKIGKSETRVGFIQFSDLFRKEFDLNQYSDSDSLKTAIGNVPYLAGLTHTGEAIDFMMKEGFASSRSDVRRVAIVITDGRAQDNVADPAAKARKNGVALFAVGVTDHVQQSQLEEIAGNKSRVFIVGAFKDLNTRLRAVIQKELCPSGPPIKQNECPNCDAARNYVCKDNKCVCPDEFCEDPVNKICGGQLCNPDLSFATCPYPSVCKQTPYKNYRCACPSASFKCQTDGGCGGGNQEACPANQKRNPSSNQCEGCNPPCDLNKNQVCQANQKGDLACACKEGYTLDCVTNVCTINECLIPGLNKCSKYATCTDTQQSYYCTCFSGYTDKSDGKGYVCEKIENACASNRHNCSQYADCIADSLGGYTCRCKDGYIDKNPNLPGRQCEKKDNECEDERRNNCSKNADCFDLECGYRCVCKSGYTDMKPTEDPGRFCFIDPCQDTTKNDCYMKRCRVIDIQTGKFECEPCPSGYTDMDPSRPGRNCQNKVPRCSTTNECDKNAYCIEVADKPDDYTCRCRDGFYDTSPDKTRKPGRKCDPIKNPCTDPSLNDCDPNADCRDLGNNLYNCTCRNGFLDKSPDLSRPGRTCRKNEDLCLNPQLNNCSVNADCKYFEISNWYNCTCKSGYKDQSQFGLFGRICKEITVPCAKNNCDKHATCKQLGDNDYTCECIPPYKDASTSNDTQTKGRKCLYGGCGFAGYNTCVDADCVDGEDHVTCKCKPGYFDADPYHPGTKCVKVIYCGGRVCNETLGLKCTNDTCRCPSGYIQDTDDSSCYQVKITTPTPPKNYCLDFPECPLNNGTCVNYKDYADCVCLNGYVDLRKYPPAQKRVCHGDAFCLLPIDIDYCCLQIHTCHASAVCLKLPTGGYQCHCRDVGTTVADNVACPAVAIPTPGRVAKDVMCPECNNNGGCTRSETTGEVICQCATWYTGSHCETDVRIILAIIFAILFLLLSLCCLLYFCLKCRCFRGAAAGAGAYREMQAGGSSGSEHLSGSDFYAPYVIPRPKLKEGAGLGGGHETVTEDRSREERNLERFLESRERAPSAERVGGGTDIVTDVAPRLPYGRGESEYDSASESGSEASEREQYERRVTTDYKKTETTRTVGGADSTTAQFHVFPPVRTEHHAMTSSSAAAADASGAGGSGERSFRESTTTTRYQADDDASSEEGSYGSTTTEDEGGVYDKKTLVKRSHQFEPSTSGGRGGSEKFVTEVSSSSKSQDTKYL